MTADGSQSTLSGSAPPGVPWLDGFTRMPDPQKEPGVVHLDHNERLEPFPDWFLEKVRAGVTSDLLTVYGDRTKLLDALSRHAGVPREMLVPTPGSDAGLKSLFQAFARPGDTVVSLDPSYAMYPVYAQMFQAKLVGIPFDGALEVSRDRLLAAVKPGVRFVLIANPNQPTGTTIDDRLVGELLEATSAVSALLAIDEAYFPFSRSTAIPLLAANPHLVVLRSLSKAGGLAGLRMGFAAAHPDVIACFNKVRSAVDVSSMALLCARLLLENPQVMDDYVKRVHEGKDLLAARVRALGLEPLESHANFMLIRVAHRCSPAKLVEALRGRGFRVKGPFSSPCIADCIRPTLGPPELMGRFADALGAALAEVQLSRSP